MLGRDASMKILLTKMMAQDNYQNYQASLRRYLQLSGAGFFDI